MSLSILLIQLIPCNVLSIKQLYDYWWHYSDVNFGQDAIAVAGWCGQLVRVVLLSVDEDGPITIVSDYWEMFILNKCIVSLVLDFHFMSGNISGNNIEICIL